MEPHNVVHVWGFDPGQTTGWCHLSVHDDGIGVFNCGESDHFQLGNLLYDNPALKAAVTSKVIDTIFVAEKFVMNSKITQSPWSLETIGLIRYFANSYHIPFQLQAPSQAKRLITNDVVKRADIYKPGHPHAMDAVRHALWYLTVKRGLLTDIFKDERLN